ncbi:hypothetical protein ACO2Q0_02130 [Phenylobacterium sp. VNQ135]|uniref:hypothetical protein n=1 Tax=Phenylobacterium sp. VNQ135 TaxID=3400922 RepID=UPI003BFFAEA0
MTLRPPGRLRRWKKRMIGLGVAFLVFAADGAAGAPLDADPLSAFYGATLEISTLDGWRAERRIRPDHTFTQTGSDGAVEGTWTLEAGKLCTTQRRPAPPADRAATYCNTGPGQKLGDKWIDRDPVTGNAIFFSLIPSAD